MIDNPDSSNKKGENRQEKQAQTEGWERRDFLKLSATGVIASLAAACSARMVTPEGIAAEPQTGSGAQADGPAPESPKVPERLPNPGALRTETWQEPWTWRPQQWPERRLQLNVSRGQNPGFSPSPANFSGALFSYGGISPGPTIRVRNDDVLRLTVRNLLEMNHGMVEIGPFPAPIDVPPNLKAKICALVKEQTGFPVPEDDPAGCPVFIFPEQAAEALGADLRPNWHIGGHVNRFHAAHTTNIHTHGLHVQPQANEDGSHSDNIFLRVIPHGDYDKRKAELREGETLLNPHEHVGELDYEFRLSVNRKSESIPHPPGTHWYHPHSHGSTHIQVSSGMAGFLVVEGDVDQSINQAMTGEDWPDPETAAGDWDYRERLMMLQRVFIASFDTDAPPNKRQLKFPPFPAVNGLKDPTVIKLRPGAVERWRVLNGSVDGAGTKRLMVLEGQYTVQGINTYKVITETVGEGDEAQDKRKLVPVTPRELEAAKLDLQQLAVDGITLVRKRNGKAEHYIRDLSKINPGTAHPLHAVPANGESPPRAMLRGYEDCYRNGDSLNLAFNRPNEVLMTNANRTDLFFKVPLDAAGKVFTIFAAESRLHSDTHHSNLQLLNASDDPPSRRPAFD
ncbi:MAG: hypothetical protein KJO85_04240, partial [Gammaproteobacteria bacterium]|nr:hypothetical protein [Gammaproteobacteria bacterium]